MQGSGKTEDDVEYFFAAGFHLQKGLPKRAGCFSILILREVRRSEQTIFSKKSDYVFLKIVKN